MSRVHGTAHAERITREAAAAIGKDVRDWTWNAILGGLRKPTVPLEMVEHDDFFAPLQQAAHAMEIETMLGVNVTYRWREKGIQLLQMARTDHPGCIMYTITPDDDHQRVRREAATVFASLTLIMDETEVQERNAYG